MINEQPLRNPYRRVYELPTWGGMIMASIAVHEEDFNDDIWNKEVDEKQSWNNVRVEICVGGHCVGTNLKNIVDALSKDYQHQQELKAQKWEIVSKFDTWMRMENDVAVVHKEQWDKLIKSFGSHSKKDERPDQIYYINDKILEVSRKKDEVDV